jgi:hypothetical protein
MIAKISRGGRMGGLMAYLAGPGRENEHEAPHLVAGSDGLMAWWSTDELSNRDALAIAGHIEQPREMFGTEVTAPVKEYSETAGQFVATSERKDVHVWHCSLSLAPDQEALGDEVWGQVARDFVDEMGFSEASGKAPVRWAAVHHGASKNGGDHIHLAISMVREDGTKVSTHNDYKLASKVCNELEKKYGLEVVEGREVGRSARPESRAEMERATREAKAAGREPASAETHSARLSRKVRACAVASADEGEFVRRCQAPVRCRHSGRRDGLLGGRTTRTWPEGDVACSGSSGPRPDSAEAARGVGGLPRGGDRGGRRVEGSMAWAVARASRRA